jgi:hypothetical protein
MMAEKGRDPNIVALEAVYAALKDLDAAGRKKVLSSVFALLDVEGTPVLHHTIRQPAAEDRPPSAGVARPVSLVELTNEKQPGTKAQHIALFAYYREKSEGLSRFERDDLERAISLEPNWRPRATMAGTSLRQFAKAGSTRTGQIHISPPKALKQSNLDSRASESI